MGGWVRSPVREGLLDEIAGRIVAIDVAFTARVAVDGIDGAGKTSLADELAERVRTHRPVIRASVDSFHHPRTVRYRLGRDSPEGFFRDSYDYDALRSMLLDPLGPEGTRRFRRALFDVDSDAPVDSPEEEACEGAVLIFDGIFLHRPELRDYWHFSVFLEVAWAKNHHIRNFPEDWPSDPSDPRNRRYAEGQELYLRECRPRDFATMVVNNENLAEPFFA